MNVSIIPQLKHSFIFKSKHSFLLSRLSIAYTKAMLKDEPAETTNRFALAQRVKEALDSLPRGGKKRLADKCDGGKGITPQALTGWVSTGRVDKANLVVLSEETNYSVEWLITGEGQKYKAVTGNMPATQDDVTDDFQGTIAPNAVTLGGFDTWDDDTALHDDEVALNFYKDVELSAGSGRYHVIENHGRKLRFSRKTLKRHGVNTDQAACVTVSGNSMEPVLPDGCTIGIDTSKTEIKNGDLYAIDHDGHLRVKMLYQMPGDVIRLRSFNNDEWPDEHYSGEAAAKIRVIGRVFWWSVLR